MVSTFDMRATAEGTQGTIQVSGELDFFTAPRLREQIVHLHSQGASTVRLDLTGLTFIDSSGLSVLVAGYKRLRDGGGDLILTAVPAQARRVLEISGLSQVLSVE